MIPYHLICGSPILNLIDRHRDEIATIARAISASDTADLTFEAPWQARIFALIVAMVKEGHLPWTDFQSHLVKAVSHNQTNAQGQGTATVETEYFQSWLAAVEETLKKLDFMADDDLTAKIADIQSATSTLKEEQLRRSNPNG